MSRRHSASLAGPSSPPGSSSSYSAGSPPPTAAIAHMGYAPVITDSPTSTFYPTSPHTYPAPSLRSPVTPHRIEQQGGGGSRYDRYSSDGDEERAFPTVSQSSRAPLIVRERDYVDEPGEISHSGTEDTGRAGREDDDSDDGQEFVFVDPQEEPPSPLPPLAPKPVSMDPSLLPRPGPQDAYLSQFLSPLASPIGFPGGTQPPSPESERPPGPTRSSSAPGVPQVGKSSHAPAVSPPVQGKEQDESVPLFKIFSAQLDTSGDQMLKRLRNHLEAVLKMQEEVGSLHLRLESLGGVLDMEDGQDTGEMSEKANSPKAKGKDKGGKQGLQGSKVNTRVERREKGVEEIMQRLGNLSENLRSYHQLGTPRLSFPQGSHPTSAFPSRSATSATHSHPANSPSSTMSVPLVEERSRHHPLQSPPTIRSPSYPSAPTSPVGGGDAPFAPPQNKRLNLAGSSPQGKSGSQGHHHSPRVHSSLAQVTMAQEITRERSQ